MAADDIDPVDGILAVLAEGATTGTSKYALLLALLDLAPTIGEDGRLPIGDIAERLLEIHWDHARDFGESRSVLRQVTSSNRLNTTPVLSVLDLHTELAALGHSQVRYERAREILGPTEAWQLAVSRVARDALRNPIARFQRIARQNTEFLYRVAGDRHLVFFPGAADVLVRYGPVLREMTESRFVRFVVRANRLAVGPRIEEQIAEHLFGLDRHMPAAPMRRALFDLQDGRCLYTAQPLEEAGQEARPSPVDHVIPWSRLRLSAIENLVLTTQSANSSKSNLLLCPALVEKWCAHLHENETALRDLAARFGWTSDLARVTGAARAMFRRSTPTAAVWVAPSEVQALGTHGRQRAIAALDRFEEK